MITYPPAGHFLLLFTFTCASNVWAKGRIHEVLYNSVSTIVQLNVTVPVAEPIRAFFYILEKVEIFLHFSFPQNRKDFLNTYMVSALI
jgi:hypothetical protein